MAYMSGIVSVRCRSRNALSRGRSKVSGTVLEILRNCPINWLCAYCLGFGDGIGNISEGEGAG